MMSTMDVVKKQAKNMVLKPMEIDAKVLESVMLGGDLSKLTADGRVMYYAKVCESLGLNPLTKPFDYIVLNGKMTLYARKDCTQQLCNRNHISTEVAKKEKIDDIYVVTVKASMNGRVSDDDGAVNVAGLKGDALANAMMKAITKAKRRAVLGICGLGIMDESELETIEGEIKHIDTAVPGAAGNVIEHAPAPQQEATDAPVSPDQIEPKETPGQDPLTAAIGSVVSQFTGLCVGFKVRKTKNGKDVTDYIVKTESGAEIKITRWGGAHEGVKDAVCLFTDVAVSEWRRNDESEPIRQYMAREITVNQLNWEE